MTQPDKKTESFTITLPVQAIEMLEALIPLGLYGTSRAEIARQLILDQLKEMRSKDR
jgi:Arc/MetJ-type ribon-helix-helix transcriptional regulator